METDVLIIGGGIAGTTAAEVFRAANPDATVTIVSDEKHPLYSRVLLPHAVKGKIPDGKVFLKEEGFYDAAGIGYLTGLRATDVDPGEKTVSLDDGSSMRFGKLVVATGGRPKTWDVPGAELKGILQLQAYEDIARIRERISGEGDMVIVGTGFIAMEFASFAVHAGIKATVINRGPHFCSSVFGPEMGAEVQAVLESRGVTVLNNARVERVLGGSAVEGVLLADGREIACGIIGLGIGLNLNTEPFAKIGTSSGVLADAHLKTAHPNIWVAGDCCEFEDPLLGFRHVVGNWTNAMAQGRHVGKALSGEERPYEQLTSYTSMCFPGAALIYLGETRVRDGIEREAKVVAPGKAIEIHRKDGRIVGAALLNAPEYRAPLSKTIQERAETALADIVK